MSATSSTDRGEPHGSRLGAQVVVASVALAAAVLVATVYGAEPISIARAFGDADSLDRVLVTRARLPRVALAALSGGGLGATGAVLQSLLRNPLADPYLLGVSGGASVGATLAILLGVAEFSALGAAVIPLAALGGALAAAILVHTLSARSRRFLPGEMLLAGVVVNAIAAAAVTFLRTLASPARAQQLLFWLVGYIDVPSGPMLATVTSYVLAGTVLLGVDAARVNLLSLGEEAAGHLGVDVSRLARRVLLVCSAIIAAIVSVTGLIGFVGLLVPHLVRRATGPDLRGLVPLSFLAGAALLVICDLVVRAAFPWLGTEIPVGAITALVGGPLFLLLLAKPR